MPIPDFTTLRALDISRYLEKRDNMDYLNHARCKALLHEQGADVVIWTPKTLPNGSSLFMSDRDFADKNGVLNRVYEVEVHIVIDSLEFDYRTPVMNGTSPVKDNSMSQQRVWNAQTRAFVKGVAMRTGLGFDLWLKEEAGAPNDDLSVHKLWAIKRRIEETLTAKTQRGMAMDDICASIEIGGKRISEKSVITGLKYLDWMSEFERQLDRL